MGAAGVAAACVGIIGKALEERGARRLALALEAAAVRGAHRQTGLEAVLGELARVSHIRWGGLVDWSEEQLDGSLQHELGDPVARPSEAALVSWLVRDGDPRAELLPAPGAELGRSGTYAALPLRSEGKLTAYALFAFPHALPRRVERALRAAREPLSAALCPAQAPAAGRPALRVAS